MTRFVVWLVAGVPALLLAVGLLVPRRRGLTLAAYGAIAVGFGIVAAVDPVSAAAVGSILALLYASGRGGADEERPPAHEPGVPRVVERPERAR